MLDKQVIAYLKEFHQGEGKAAISRELEAAFNIRGRELREIVNRLRAQGLPICSSEAGYYYAADMQELDRTIRQLSSRIKNIAVARHGLLKARSLYTDDRQTTLPLEGGDHD